MICELKFGELRKIITMKKLTSLTIIINLICGAALQGILLICAKIHILLAFASEFVHAELKNKIVSSLC